jgi:hypothetical protein
MSYQKMTIANGLSKKYAGDLDLDQKMTSMVNNENWKGVVDKIVSCTSDPTELERCLSALSKAYQDWKDMEKRMIDREMLEEADIEESYGD